MSKPLLVIGICLTHLSALALAGLTSPLNSPAPMNPPLPLNSASPLNSPTALGNGEQRPAAAPRYKDDAVSHYNKAVALHSTGYLNKALVEYRAAVAVDPRISEAWSNMGAIYALQQSFDKAAEADTTALDLAPHNNLAFMQLSSLAQLQDEHGDSSKAEPLYRVLVALPPPAKGAARKAYIETVRLYAQLLGRAGKRAEAKSMNARAAALRSETAPE